MASEKRWQYGVVTLTIRCGPWWTNSSRVLRRWSVYETGGSPLHRSLGLKTIDSSE